MKLSDLLANWLPGSEPQPWTWDDEERDILARVCLCCDQPGHYQQLVEAAILADGIRLGVCLGSDGRVWDGHHRIVAARRLGIEEVPIEGDKPGAVVLEPEERGALSWLPA